MSPITVSMPSPHHSPIVVSKNNRNRSISPRGRSRVPVPKHLDFKNTALSPIIRGDHAYTTPNNSSFRKRRGLVQRTHSPKAKKSPMSRMTTSPLCLSQVVHTSPILSPLMLTDTGATTLRSRNTSRMHKFFPKKRKRSKSPALLHNKKEALGGSAATTATRSKRMALGSTHPKQQLEQQQLPEQEACSATETTTTKAKDTLPSKAFQFQDPVMDVKMLTPSVTGINQVSKALRGNVKSSMGIVSFPTETVYTLSCFVPFVRPSTTATAITTSSSRLSSSSSTATSSAQETLERLLEMKQKPSTTRQLNHTQNLDPPLLYFHNPQQAKTCISFTKPKTFVYKRPKEDTVTSQAKTVPVQLPPSPTSTTTLNTTTITTPPTPPETKTKQEYTLTAIRFSESHEVLNRLTSVFWPGPVTIYAPVRHIQKNNNTTKNSNTKELSSKHKGEPQNALVLSQSNENASSSTSSLTSLCSEYSVEDSSGDARIPILPKSALVSSTELGLDSCNTASSKENPSTGDAAPCDEETVYYVGMRCPSHPLARRVLTGVYDYPTSHNNKSGKVCKSKSPSPQGAVLSFSASIPGDNMNVVDRSGNTTTFLSIPSTVPTPSPVTSKQVYTNLKSYQSTTTDISTITSTSSSSSNMSINTNKKSVHIINGEDKREIFNVPTCQFSSITPTSLIIDAKHRSVIIQRGVASSTSNDNLNGTTNDTTSITAATDLKNEMDCSFHVKKEDVVYALTQPKRKGGSNDCKTDKDCIKDTVIASVLGRWNVISM